MQINVLGFLGPFWVKEEPRRSENTAKNGYLVNLYRSMLHTWHTGVFELAVFDEPVLDARSAAFREVVEG